jgi:antitoxin PrlF
MKASVSEKGQVTIPKKLRRSLGIVPGSVIDFEARGGRLIARKVDDADELVRSVTGIIKMSIDVDDYLNETRGKVR